MEGAKPGPDGSIRPLIFEAVEEQLGLQLQPGNEKSEVQLIDKAEKQTGVRKCLQYRMFSTPGIGAASRDRKTMMIRETGFERQEGPPMKMFLAAASWVSVSLLSANAQVANFPEFEVAAVKPASAPDQAALAFLPASMLAKMGFDGGPGTKDPDRIDYHGVTLKSLLARAYDVKPDQISGPGWLGSEYYTIQAKLSLDADQAQLQMMLQRLLTERFQIRFHWEMKETPVYRLKVAKNGPRLKLLEELPHYESEDEQREAMRKGAITNMAKMRSAVEANARSGIRTNSRRFDLPRATTERFAEVLSGNLDRPVKDMTQLEGEYSFQLEWTPDSDMGDGEPSSRVSIFTAIQEQLGFKLEAGNEVIELLVIDKAEKVPTAN